LCQRLELLRCQMFESWFFTKTLYDLKWKFFEQVDFSQMHDPMLPTQKTCVPVKKIRFWPNKINYEAESFSPRMSKDLATFDEIVWQKCFNIFFAVRTTVSWRVFKEIKKQQAKMLQLSVWNGATTFSPPTKNWSKNFNTAAIPKVTKPILKVSRFC